MNRVSNLVSSAAVEFEGATRIEMSNALARLQKQSSMTRVLVWVALFAVTASLDLAVDHNLSLFPLYLIPTLFAAWYLGSRWAYASCLAGGVVWVVDDRPGWYSYHHALIPYGNLAGRLTVLVVIVMIVSALKQTLEDEYEAERRVVVRELEISLEVQRRLLPSDLPDYPGVDLGFFYRPARELGGDYCDFIPLSSERIAIAAGDVSGKGLSSALLMASLQSLVRTNLALREGKLARAAKELNKRVYEETAPERFVTLFFGVLDTSSLTFDYVNAGHNPPLFFRKWTLSPRSASAETLDNGGPPLGLFAENQYASGRISLQEGDVFVLYTDGISDAANNVQEQFGEERLRDIVLSSLYLSASEICQKVADELDAFTGGSPRWDDLTLAVVKVKPDFTDSKMAKGLISNLSTFS